MTLQVIKKYIMICDNINDVCTNADLYKKIPRLEKNVG